MITPFIWYFILLLAVYTNKYIRVNLVYITPYLTDCHLVWKSSRCIGSHSIEIWYYALIWLYTVYMYCHSRTSFWLTLCIILSLNTSVRFRKNESVEMNVAIWPITVFTQSLISGWTSYYSKMVVVIVPADVVIPNGTGNEQRNICENRIKFALGSALFSCLSKVLTCERRRHKCNVFSHWLGPRPALDKKKKRAKI